MKTIKNATHTVGGHKILSLDNFGSDGKKFRVIVEDKSWASGQCTYLIGKSGRNSNEPLYSIKPC